MTDEEKAEKHTKENYCNKCYLQNCSRRKNVSCYAMHYNDFLDGLAEGRKEGYEQGKKDYITNDRSYVIPTKEMSYVEIAKENAELKKDKEYLDKVNNEQTEVILHLNERIEKMKCCENCKHSYTDCENNVLCYLPLSQENCKSCKTYNHKDTDNDYWELAE